MVKTIKRFIAWESSAGLLLMIMALIALLVSNSPLAKNYADLLSLNLSFSLGKLSLSKPLILWVNEGIMTIFFLLVGLEIKREFLEGELRDFKHCSLPIFAAVGGMALPAAIYVFINWGNEYALHGWAIPAATDIAFALGVLSLLGTRVPSSLKIFLSAIAILDDIGTIIIIAVFYTAELSMTSLVLASCCMCILFILNRAKVYKFTPYALVGIAMWLCVLESGVHATLTGIILALFYPIRDPSQEDYSPLREMEKAIHPWVAFGILPLFAFANAGVSFKGVTLETLIKPVPLGIICGLFLGKQLGVFSVSWIAIRSGIAKLPKNSTWSQFYGVTILCGIGFTMSLFIGTLAFAHSSIDYHVWLRIGVLTGSLLSAVLGLLVLLLLRSSTDKKLPT